MMFLIKNTEHEYFFVFVQFRFSIFTFFSQNNKTAAATRSVQQRGEIQDQSLVQLRLSGDAEPIALAAYLHRQLRAIERHYAHREWDRLPPSEKRHMAHLLHALRTRPQFVAYSVKDLPAAAPLIARMMFGRPLLTWTVRSEADRRRAARWADQIIFEGIRP